MENTDNGAIFNPLAHAIELASLGFRVLPLMPRAKVPRLRDWPKKATNERRTIRRWFKEHPDDNLGLATGDGIIALDVDRDTGGHASLARLAADHGGFPTTATARTGSGGIHLLFRTDHPLGNRTGILPGLDVRGEGGQIVVEPSIHPRTGEKYGWVRHPREGIARAPDWLVDLLSESAAKARPAPLPVGGREVELVDRADETIEPQGSVQGIALQRRGSVEALSRELIRRFPVGGHGRRHAAMTRAVGHLAGHGYEQGLIVEAVNVWHDHFHRNGNARTDPRTAAMELEACIRSTIRSIERGTFRSAGGDLGHAARCDRILLNAGQRELIDKGIVVSGEGGKALTKGLGTEKTPGPEQVANCKRVTQFHDRLCKSDDERAFVEALVVHVLYKIQDTGEYASEGVIRMTCGQIRRISAARNGVNWGPQQLERLKLKYLTRADDGKPASRLELLREISKGKRGRGDEPGAPSVFEATGILSLL